MKTKEELRRDGQYRADRHRDRPTDDQSITVSGEPVIMAGNRADELSEIAFNAVIASLPPGTIGAADSMALTVLSMTWSRWTRLHQQLENWCLEPESDEYNRIFRQVMDCEKQIRTLSNEFGLTPRSRSQIKLMISQSEKQKSPQEELEDIRDELDAD